MLFDPTTADLLKLRASLHQHESTLLSLTSELPTLETSTCLDSSKQIAETHIASMLHQEENGSDQAVSQRKLTSCTLKASILCAPLQEAVYYDWLHAGFITDSRSCDNTQH